MQEYRIFTQPVENNEAKGWDMHTKIFIKALSVFNVVVCLNIFLVSCVEADVVKLKSGRIVEGKIVTKTEDSVKIDFNGVTLTFYNDEIAGIEDAGIDDASSENANVESVPAVNAASESVPASASIKPDKRMPSPPPVNNNGDNAKVPAQVSSVEGSSMSTTEEMARPTTGQFKVFDAILDQQQADMQRLLEQQKQRIKEYEEGTQEYYDNLLNGEVR